MRIAQVISAIFSGMLVLALIIDSHLELKPEIRYLIIKAEFLRKLRKLGKGMYRLGIVSGNMSEASTKIGVALERLEAGDLVALQDGGFIRVATTDAERTKAYFGTPDLNDKDWEKRFIKRKFPDVEYNYDPDTENLQQRIQESRSRGKEIVRGLLEQGVAPGSIAGYYSYSYLVDEEPLHIQMEREKQEDAEDLGVDDGSGL